MKYNLLIASIFMALIFSGCAQSYDFEQKDFEYDIELTNSQGETRNYGGELSFDEHGFEFSFEETFPESEYDLEVKENFEEEVREITQEEIEEETIVVIEDIIVENSIVNESVDVEIRDDTIIVIIENVTNIEEVINNDSTYEYEYQNNTIEIIVENVTNEEIIFNNTYDIEINNGSIIIVDNSTIDPGEESYDFPSLERSINDFNEGLVKIDSLRNSQYDFALDIWVREEDAQNQTFINLANNVKNIYLIAYKDLVEIFTNYDLIPVINKYDIIIDSSMVGSGSSTSIKRKSNVIMLKESTWSRWTDPSWKVIAWPLRSATHEMIHAETYAKVYEGSAEFREMIAYIFEPYYISQKISITYIAQSYIPYYSTRIGSSISEGRFQGTLIGYYILENYGEQIHIDFMAAWLSSDLQGTQRMNSALDIAGVSESYEELAALEYCDETVYCS